MPLHASQLLLLDEPLAALMTTPARNRLRGDIATAAAVWHSTRLRHTTAWRRCRSAIGVDEGHIVAQPVQGIFNRPANLAVAGIVAVETISLLACWNCTTDWPQCRLTPCG